MPGPSAALVDERLAGLAKAKSARKGYLDGRALAEVFAWLRPGDLVWNYWVNNYLLGKRPPAFDILFWNSDTTRMTAALHADFVDLAMDELADPARSPHRARRADRPRAITVDSYVVAGIADHISPVGELLPQSPSSSAAQPGSCCPPVATSPPWSTRRETPRPRTTLRRTVSRPAGVAPARRDPPRILVDRPRAGWPSAAARRPPLPTRWAAAAWHRYADAPGTYVYDR